MRPDYLARGGAPVAVLNRMEAWEASLVLNIRQWSEGPEGRAQVKQEYIDALSGFDARQQFHNFEALLNMVLSLAQRPLVRHDVSCSCVGADEGVLLNIIRTAADGYLNDAALISTLLVGPAHAEQVAILAGAVGECARQINLDPCELPNDPAQNIARLH
ncbi:MAG: hypothetical protein AAF496_16935 [Pseudomonadota bacterium]